MKNLIGVAKMLSEKAVETVTAHLPDLMRLFNVLHRIHPGMQKTPSQDLNLKTGKLWESFLFALYSSPFFFLLVGNSLRCDLRNMWAILRSHAVSCVLEPACWAEEHAGRVPGSSLTGYGTENL